jgi:Tol biopolymer transport system component
MNKIFFYPILFISLNIFCQEEPFTVVNLKMNNELPHFGLTLTPKNTVLFTSYLVNKKGKVKMNGVDPILTLYEGQISSDGNIINIEQLPIDNSQDLNHITSGSLSPDGKRLYVATNYINIKNKPKGTYKETNFFIQAGEYQEGIGWTNFKTLPFCQPKYSYSHPNISPDGKWLYFISNIRGGNDNTRGPSDVFRVEIQDDGSFGKPENLGSNVNSYSREMFPFISADNILYFSSNKPNGVGGFDIYKAKMKDDGTFEKAEILPEPINSKESDVSFVIDAKGNGFLASKRNGGQGDDDLYYFTKN